MIKGLLHKDAAALFSLVMRTNEKIHTNKIKAKSLAHLFKGGRSPEGGAIWSRLPQW